MVRNFQSQLEGEERRRGGGGKEEAGTKQIFPVSSTKVARDLGTPGRKRRGNLEKLRLSEVYKTVGFVLTN